MRIENNRVNKRQIERDKARLKAKGGGGKALACHHKERVGKWKRG